MVSTAWFLVLRRVDTTPRNNLLLVRHNARSLLHHSCFRSLLLVMNVLSVIFDSLPIDDAVTHLVCPKP